MEKLKVKHDHSLTDILKVLIFAIVLLMPFLVYAPTALYYAFNEHAQGYETITEGGYEYIKRYNTNEVNTKNDLIENNYYYLDYTFIDTTQFGTITDVEYDSNYYEFYETIGDYDANYIEVIDCNLLVRPNASNVGVIVNWTIGEVCLYKEGTNNRVSWKFEVPVNVANTNVTGDYQNNGSATTCAYCGITCVFQYKSTQYINDNLISYISELPNKYQIYDRVYSEEVEVTKNITQMMEKNWDDLWNTNLFKWTDTSILKNGLDNFTQAFGITNTSHINNLIAYELIMVGVYIVIDIVLALFKWLTHMIGNK